MLPVPSEDDDDGLIDDNPMGREVRARVAQNKHYEVEDNEAPIRGTEGIATKKKGKASHISQSTVLTCLSV